MPGRYLIVAFAAWCVAFSQAQIALAETSAQITLGRKLFFDRRLSANGEVSCAACHQPERAFTDGKPRAEVIAGLTGTRNTPSLLNVRHFKRLFWDGRRATLEEQVREPFVNPREHGLSDHAALLRIVASDPEYAGLSQLEHVAAALAAYLRSLTPGPAPFDRYWTGRDEHALTRQAANGFALFHGRAGCAKCHVVEGDYPLFTDQDFHSVGVGLEALRAELPALVRRAAATPREALDRLVTSDEAIAQLGRFVVTGSPRDIGKFRTPSLRNVGITAPYMHDGSIATLGQVIDHELYYRALAENRPIVLTPEEKGDLASFLRSLTDERLGGRP